MARGGGYGSNHMVVIKESFTNLTQETVEDRVEATNITDANAIPHRTSCRV